MKKLDKKLSLNRETLASLTDDQLTGVAGGDIGPGGTATTLTRTTMPLTSRIGCPSRLPGICETDPTRTRLVCGPQGGQQK
jgi:hypothetical protein